MAKKAKNGSDLGLLVLGASALFLFLRLSKETEKDKQNRAIQEELRAGITPPSLGATTLRSAGWKKRGKNYMKQWITRQGIVVAHLQAAKGGSYVWDVKLHTSPTHRGYFANFPEHLLAQGTAPNATKAAYRATVAGLSSPFLSRAGAEARG